MEVVSTSNSGTIHVPVERLGFGGALYSLEGKVIHASLQRFQGVSEKLTLFLFWPGISESMYVQNECSLTELYTPMREQSVDGTLDEFLRG